MFKKSKRREVQRSTSKLETKSITRIVISFLVAVLAWVGATSFESYLLSDKNQSKAVIATQDVKEGTFIDENNRDEYFKVITVNSDLVNDKIYSEVNKIKGKVLCDISSGEIISSNRIYDTSKVVSDIKNPVEISFAIDNASDAMNGHIRKGDLVDILITTHDESSDSNVSTVYKKNVYISDVYDSSYKKIEDNDSETLALFFKIELESSDVADFNTIISNGSITLVKSQTEY